METYTFENDVAVIGSKVSIFPMGISEAFGSLMAMLPHGKERRWCGISYLDGEGNIQYYTAAEELTGEEAQAYNLDKFTIEKGEYLKEKIVDWRSHTGCMKDVFHDMMKDGRIDKTKPCVEWYKDDNEMFCMIKMTGNIE